MLSINNISMRFGARVLFEDVTTTFLSGRRYAITGPNGAGKSTLMRILTGEIEPSKGSVTRPKKIGVLRQDQFAFDSYRVIDTVIMGNAPLWAALQDREALYAKDHDELTDEDGMRLGELEGIVGDEGGYTAESDAAVLLDGLDIGEELHDRKMSELQGGQKVRVLLAQALFGNPSVLLLDEPTNHLDLESVHWLQDYLLDVRGLPHRHLARPAFPERGLHAHRGHRLRDRHHLHGRLRRYGARENADSRQRRGRKCAAGKEDRAVERVHRPLFGRHAVLAGHVAKERSGAAADIGTGEVEHPAAVHPLQRSNALRAVIRWRSRDSRNRTKAFRVIDKFTASVSRGEKIALIGRNGAGKTTLLRSLMRNAPGPIDAAERAFAIDAGTVTWGHEVSVGYFSQDHRQSIRAGVTLIDWLHEFDPMASQAELRGRARADAVQRRRCVEADRSAFRRRSGAPDILPPDAGETQLPGAGRADQSPGPGIHQRLEYRAAALRRHGAPGHARSRCDRRSGHPHLELRGRRDRRLQGSVRGFPRGCGTGRVNPPAFQNEFFPFCRPEARYRTEARCIAGFAAQDSGTVKRTCRRCDNPVTRSKLNRFLFILVFTLPAFAQLDSAELRAKFGAPLSRQTFRVPLGFDLVVDYGAGNQVCKLQVPALMPMDASKVQNTDDMQRRMRAFLAELVPDSTRGKELQRFMSQTGAFSAVGLDEYEHVTVVETHRGSNDTITVTFKNAGCQQTEQIVR